MTNEQQPADQGRGVGELIDELRAEAALHTGSSAADETRGLIERAIAALTQPKGGDNTVVTDAQVESKAEAMFNEYKDAMAAPWDRQWIATRGYWRKKARAALSLPRQSEAEPVVSDELVKRAGKAWNEFVRDHHQSCGLYYFGPMKAALEAVISDVGELK